MAGIWTSAGRAASVRDAARVTSYRGEFCQQEKVETAAGPLTMAAFSAGREDRNLAQAFGRRIAFDGWIFNWEELSEALGAPVVRCDSYRPAELLLAAFEAWGMECFKRIEGVFALVLWDEVAEKLIAVRDRFGTRPLYFHYTGLGIAFASEMKQFFASGTFSIKLNLKSASEFLMLGLTDHSIQTMMEGVQAIPAGHMAEMDLSTPGWPKRRPAVKQWYELPRPDTLHLQEEEAIERFRDLLMESVMSRMGRPGIPGICLSGGLDSAAIAGALAANGLAEELISLKASFGDPKYDEPALLHSVLKSTGACCYVVMCRGGEAFDVLEKLVWHLDEPSGRASLAAQWLLFEKAGSLGVNYTLDGQGADEQLAGYTSMLEEAEANARGGWQEAPNAIGPSSRAQASRLTVGRWLASAFSTQICELTEQKAAVARDLGRMCRDRMLVGDLPMMMRHNDRIGMAYGIETHVPFLSHRLVEFCIRLGRKFKIVRGETKYLLRHAGLAPQIVRDQRGKGSYSELEATWLRGECWRRLVKEVKRTAGEWPQLFQAEAARKLSETTPELEKDTLMFLWRIAAFGVWARRFNVGL